MPSMFKIFTCQYLDVVCLDDTTSAGSSPYLLFTISLFSIFPVYFYVGIHFKYAEVTHHFVAGVTFRIGHLFLAARTIEGSHCPQSKKI